MSNIKGNTKKDMIHKHNSIIKSFGLSKLNINSLKLLNFLYFHIQKFSEKNNDILLNKSINIPIKQTTIRETLNITDSNYGSIIRDILKNLKDTNIELYDFEENGKIYKWGYKSLIYDIYEEIAEDNKTVLYRIETSVTLFNLIKNHNKKNFTKLKLNYTKKFRSNRTFILYEYLKSIENLYLKKEHTIKWFNDFFGKNIKYLSKVKELLEPSIKVINENTDIKVSLSLDKKRKIFVFNIEENIDVLTKEKILKEKEKERKKKERISKLKEKEEKTEEDIIDKILNKYNE